MSRSIADRIAAIPVDRLPDHRPISPQTYRQFFDNDEVAGIAKRFKFAGIYPLEEKLDEVALYFRATIDNKAKSSPLKEEELFQAGISATKLLESILQRFGRPELVRIGARYISWNRQATIETLRELRRILQISSTPTEQQQGRPANSAQAHFVLCLAEIYEGGTSNKAGYTQIPDKNEFKGQFVEFVDFVARILGEKIEPSFVANIIKERSRENPP